MGEIRTIPVSALTENIREMCIEANHFLSKDMELVQHPFSQRRFLFLHSGLKTGVHIL